MKKNFAWLHKIEVSKESTFHCVGNILGTRIFIKGINNHLEISENTNILNYDIVIKGSDNCLKFDNDSGANGNHVSLTMWKDED
ncbi:MULTISPECIES: hypothetical protein [Calothrix]|uniref:Uncharacterized protein n=2 Tax=Calothrix TaxID=1186 RepID=A0ABR8A6E2_9CYAN|nr:MULTISPECIES: hypothetical protein [Calothrix]MBD2195434.1 hypothetical protein [Calothrix parietina FACHB-288]MBD2223096.1 hypothetical protein [Calothrix anomala FACHB-343]